MRTNKKGVEINNKQKAEAKSKKIDSPRINDKNIPSW